MKKQEKAEQILPPGFVNKGNMNESLPLTSLTVTVWFFSNACPVVFALILDAGDWQSTGGKETWSQGSLLGPQLGDLGVSKHQVAGPVLGAPL